MKPTGNLKQILVVDGSNIVLDRIKGILKEVDGIDRVLTANGYAAAIATMTTTHIDIVLSEITLFDKSGFELLTYIKHHYPETKTIMLTNLAGDFYRNKSKALGADHFIDKSEEFENIARIIQQYHSALFQLH